MKKIIYIFINVVLSASIIGCSATTSQNSDALVSSAAPVSNETSVSTATPASTEGAVSSATPVSNEGSVSSATSVSNEALVSTVIPTSTATSENKAAGTYHSKIQEKPKLPIQKQTKVATTKAITANAKPIAKTDDGEQDSKENKAILEIRDDNGNILEPTEISFEEGDTVFDVLKNTVREKKIHMEFSGKKTKAYIEGINNLYEFDKGAGSGWMYSVNGIFPNRSCGDYPVYPEDEIRWLYTLDLGKDLGVDVNGGLESGGR